MVLSRLCRHAAVISLIMAPIMTLANIPQTAPPPEVVQTLPPADAPVGDYTYGQAPPLPELPPKTEAWHVEGNFFPESIFDRPADLARKPPPDNSEIDPRPGGRWLHTCVEIDNSIVCYGGVTDERRLLNDVWIYSPLKTTWDYLERPSIPVPVNTINSEKSTPEEESGQGRPDFAPKPPKMRDPPHLEKAGGLDAVLERTGIDPMLNVPDEVDLEGKSLPITHTPIVPLVNPDEPTLFKVKKRRRRLLEKIFLERGKEHIQDGIQLGSNDAVQRSNLNAAHVARRRSSLRHNTRPPDLPDAHSVLDTQTAMDVPSLVTPVDVLWTFDIEASSWWKMGNLEGANPRPRSMHTALALGGKMLIFGGVASGSHMLMNDVWSLDMGERKWQEVIIAKDLPSPIPREGHTMVSGIKDTTGSFTIFGGMGYSYAPLDDVWTLNVQTGQWRALTKGTVEEERPPARWMHSAVAIDGKMYIFGGCSASFAAMEDTWVFDGENNEWERVEPIGFPPPARWLHTANVIRADIGSGDNMLIFGGASNNSPLQDMWVFSPADSSWVETQAFLNVPFAREGHASTMIKPEAKKKKRRRRRRLLMDPGDDQITPETSIVSAAPAIDGPRPTGDTTKPEVKEDTAAQQFLFIFGGSSEPGLVGEMQDASPM